MTKTATAVRIPAARRVPGGTTPAEGGTFRRDVAGLRAVAAALIVLFDAGVPGLTGGYVGVDVFFVISGYLITALLLREAGATGRISLTGFYGRRARRVLPAACLVLVAVIVAARARPGLPRPGLTLSPGTDEFAGLAGDHLAAPLEHLWSLAVAAPFYLIWPIVLSVLLRLSRRFDVHRAIAFTLGCAVGGSLAWSALHAGTWSYLSPVTRAWEVGAGALLALAGNDRFRIPYRLAGGLSWLGLALILTSALVYRPSTPFPGLAAVVPVLGTVLVLTGRGEGLLGLPPLQWLGRISYPLYLWHWPVLILAARAHGGPLPGPVRGVVVLAGVGLAAATYVLVERPIQRNARLRRSPALTLALAGLMIAAPLVAARGTRPTSSADLDDAPRPGAPAACPARNFLPGGYPSCR